LSGGLLGSNSSAWATPAGGVVAKGNGSISQTGAAGATTTTIQQNSQNLFVNWTSFDTGKNETVNFVQPSATAVAVNRILGTDGTQFLGTLNAKGLVYVINPNGVVFGQGSQVNVGGLVASTLDVSDDQIGSASQTFSGTSKAGVSNAGTIKASNGGSVVLLGNQVSNTGSIIATSGTVALSGGNTVSLTLDGNRVVGLQVNQNLYNTLVANGGVIQANGGQVFLTAGAANSLLASVVNNTGVIEAQTAQGTPGHIELLGGMAAGTVNVGGTLDASAPSTGNGGLIETSAAHVKVANDAVITTKAAHGLTGTWSIDPTDFTIAASGGDMTGKTLSTELASTSVQIQSANGTSAVTGDSSTSTGGGNINVNDAVSWSSGTTLTLTAGNNININAPIDASQGQGGVLALQYGMNNPNAGNTSDYYVKAPISLQAGQNFSTQQGSDGGVVNYTVITQLGAQGSTTGTDLQGMNGNLYGNYALGANIDASATSGWNGGAGFTPIGENGFNGVFAGLGHTVSNLMINQDLRYLGLIGKLYPSGVVREVGLINNNVTGGVSSGYVGSLVGGNWGTINNVYATGSVSGGYGTQVGGLVGYNNGTISNAYTTETVAGNQSYSCLGGLVGCNDRTIINVYSTGTVVGTGYEEFVGGLVGVNGGYVNNAYSTGAVTGGNAGNVGGLVGNNGGTINNVYATGAVTGGSNAAYVGGLVGLNWGPISNSYATGSVSGGDFSYVGGFIGYNSRAISSAYATGAVSGGNGAVVGGFVGNDDFGTYLEDYWNTQLSGTTQGVGAPTGVSGITGLTSAQMGRASNFSGWDFTNTWTQTSNGPILTPLIETITVTPNSSTLTYSGNAVANPQVSYVASGFAPAFSSASISAGGYGSLSYTWSQNGSLSSNPVNAGSYSVSASGLQSTNPYLVFNYQTGTLTINPAQVTISNVTASNKVYDTTTNALIGSMGLATVQLGNADGTLAGPTAYNNYAVTGTFASASAGNQTVNLTSTLLNNYNGNYVLSSSSQKSTTATINQAQVTVSNVAASNKVYDTTTNAAITQGTATVQLGDPNHPDGTLASSTPFNGYTESGNFATATAGNNKTVNLQTALTDSTNFALASSSQTSTTATINQAQVTVSNVAASNKVYDRTHNAAITQGTATVQLGDPNHPDGTLAKPTAFSGYTESGNFATSTAGANKTVNLQTALTDSTDYAVSSSNQTSTTATINQAQVTVSNVTASNKVYDTTTNAAVSQGTASVVLGDAENPNGSTLAAQGFTHYNESGSFVNAAAGTNKTVNLKTTLADSTDFALASNNQTSTTATINQAQVTVSGVTASNKVSDGTTKASVTQGTATVALGDPNSPNGGTLDAQAFTNYTESGAFTNATAGVGKTVALQTTLGDATNYTTSSQSQKTTTANINSSVINLVPTQVFQTGKAQIDVFVLPAVAKQAVFELSSAGDAVEVVLIGLDKKSSIRVFDKGVTTPRLFEQ
jgi:filamentous hemagglutinin family protein